MLKRAPAAVPAAPIRRVRISDPDSPGDVLVISVKWLCPRADCRRPRGEVTNERLPYGERSIRVDRWRNVCGHVDLGRDLVAESDALMLQQAIARGLKDRHSAT